MKYIAFKLEGLSFWVWFDQKKVTRSSDRVVAKDGWGKEGDATNINVPLDLIQAEMESEVLGYDS